MVGTKAADKEFDFKKDTVEMFLDGDLLRAKGTTLGGDDGTGIAAAFALAEKDIKRGPLEILCTIDEEIGLIGAQGLVEGELLSKEAKYLINIDSEDWGEICLSCAGAGERLLHLPVVRAKAPEGFSFFKMTLKDFYGGHTGVEIHSNRANAIRWAAALLSENASSLNGTPFIVDAFEGGNAHNAVPSFATVV
jgi:dipeptidase D